MPPRVRDRKNQDALALDTIDDPVGKTPHERPTIGAERRTKHLDDQ